MSELTKVLDRVRQDRTGRRQTDADTRANVTTNNGAASGASIAGTRVFDRVTGEEGIILGRHTENIIVPITRR